MWGFFVFVFLVVVPLLLERDVQSGLKQALERELGNR